MPYYIEQVRQIEEDRSLYTYNPLIQQGSIDDMPLFVRVDMNEKSHPFQ